MKIFSMFLLFFGTFLGLNAKNASELLSKAEKLYYEKCYEEAIPIYESILEGVDGFLYENEIRCHLAHSYIEINQPEKGRLLLTLISTKDENIKKEKDLLLASAYRKMKNSNEAIKVLEPYATLPFPNRLTVELATNYFISGKYKEAKDLLESLKWKDDHSDSFVMSQLYLGELYLRDKNWEKAETVFSQLQILPEHRFSPLWFYLQEMVRYQKEQNLKIAESNYKTMATTFWAGGEFENSYQIWQKFIEDLPHSSMVTEALYNCAKYCEKNGDQEKRKEYLKRIYENYPSSHLASRAYIELYSLREYLYGDKKATKHLQAMERMFPQDPLLIYSHYILGLGYKKDHRSENGKSIIEKDWILAIDAFNHSETLYDELKSQDKIPSELYSYYTQIRYRANLERALANKAIAESSEGAKKKVYTEYAMDVFKQIRNDFHDHDKRLNEVFINPYPEVLEEAEFNLAKLYADNGKPQEAELAFNHMLTHYNRNQKTLYLSRLWFEKSRLEKNRQQYHLAIEHLKAADQAYDNLEIDERLEIWIQEALCYKERGQFEDAMRLLSKIVNSESISSQRLRAMYLRGDVYEAQGKQDLAIKQWESLAKKGGPWALKANEKLNNPKNGG